MTDARLPERFLMDRRFSRLNDADFRSYVCSLLWSVSNRTDGVIEPEDVALIPGCHAKSPGTLAAAGLWSAAGRGWVISDFEATQTSRHDLEVLENARRADRLKKQKARASRPGDGPGDVSRGQHRKGKDRQGEERQATTQGWMETTDESTGEVVWNVVQIPTGELMNEEKTA